MSRRPLMRRSPGFRRGIGTLALLAALAAGCHSNAVTPQMRPSTPGATSAQGLVGFTEWNGLRYERADPGDPDNVAGIDLSTMPTVGFAGQYALGGDRVEWGLDGGFLLSWDADRSTVATGGGSAVIVVDRSLVLLDMFFGGYASATFDDQVRIYGGVAPDFLWGRAWFDDEVGSDSSSDFSVGISARGGVEFRLADRSFFGVGVRWLSNDLDFGPVLGSDDFEGWQFFVTLTQGL